MKLAIIDDHPILLGAVKTLIATKHPEYEISSFSRGQELLDELKTTDFDLIITDISMPEMQGTELVTEVRNITSDVKIIVLSTHKNERLIQNLFNQKINGYVFKDYAANEIVEAVELVLDSGKYISESVQQILDNANKEPDKKLTQREIEIIQHIAKGLLNKEIADKCFISEATVKTHRKNIMNKLELGNTADLVRYAVSNSLI